MSHSKKRRLVFRKISQTAEVHFVASVYKVSDEWGDRYSVELSRNQVMEASSRGQGIGQAKLYIDSMTRGAEHLIIRQNEVIGDDLHVNFSNFPKE